MLAIPGKIVSGKSVGKMLRDLRRRAGLTQQQLAHLSGIDRATVSLIENGHEDPRTGTLIKLADALEVEPRVLLSMIPSGPGKEAGEEVVYDFGHGPAAQLHPGLRALLGDERTRLMLAITPEEEKMLSSIRTRSEIPLTKDFFVDVLISYRRHQLNDGDRDPHGE